MRLISALVLGPLALLGAWFGGWFFAALVIGLAIMAFGEWTAMVGAREPVWARLIAAAALAAGLVLLAAGRPFAATLLIAAPAAAALVAAASRASCLWLALGLAYVAVPSAAAILIRADHPHGRWVILFIFAVAWMTDIAAYFGGRTIGGPKLWPRVSPKKTWSGAAAGIAAALLVGAVAAVLAGGAAAVLAAAALLSVATQAGDLLESAVKRRFKVKDSGRIIPGHGGVLDRVDGLYAACAVAWGLLAAGAGPLPVAAGSGGQA
jgi:phosphatidate cytidylyltransferase